MCASRYILIISNTLFYSFNFVCISYNLFRDYPATKAHLSLHYELFIGSLGLRAKLLF